LLLVIGCRSTPDYRGEGQIANTSSGRDGVPVPFAEYTIILASFPLATNVTRDFYLGDVGFFRKTGMFLSIRFLDDHQWRHFRHLTEGEKEPAYVERFHIRDVDNIQGHLSYRLLTEAGAELLHADTALNECNWSGRQLRPYPRNMVEISDMKNNSVVIPESSKLKLQFSYTGDSSLSNNAQLVLLLHPKRN
jgi:hypothetical protein